MGYRIDMENCRKYIEAHLYENIDPRELAEMFSYSYFHFCHIFRSCNGMGVIQYVRDKRLQRAASELESGRKITETAMDCGYETNSGFTRAFRRKFGIAPAQYKKMKGGIYMKIKPEIKVKKAFTAIGYVINPDQDIDIRKNGAFWLGKDFSSVSKEEYKKLTYPGYAEIGAWVHSDDTEELFYFLGPTVKDTNYIPEGMRVLEVPEAEYAIFSVPKATSPKELFENVNKTWKFIFNDWFDEIDYGFDHSKVDFEFYIGEDTYIYIPITK